MMVAIRKCLISGKVSKKMDLGSNKKYIMKFEIPKILFCLNVVHFKVKGKGNPNAHVIRIKFFSGSNEHKHKTSQTVGDKGCAGRQMLANGAEAEPGRHLAAD